MTTLIAEGSILIVAEDYRGHALEVRHFLAEVHPTWTRPERYEAFIDARTYQGYMSRDLEPTAVAALLKRARKAVDRWKADDEIRPEAELVVGRFGRGQFVAGGCVLDDWANARCPVKVGQAVALHAQGKVRPGIVTQAGRVNAEVAWTTPSSSGRIYRKAVPFAFLVRLVSA